ncbi:hypothetical protein FXO37_35618, partial [Capsicum annuum]
MAWLDKAALGPTPKSDERFERQYRYGPPPEFPLTLPHSGIVHHLSGPDRSRSVGGAPLGGIPPTIFLTPYEFTRPLTCTHVRLLGLFFKMGRLGSLQASVRSAQMPKHAGGVRYLPQSRRRHCTSVSRARALAVPSIHTGPHPESVGGLAHRNSTSDRRALPAPVRFLPDNFKYTLTLFSKFFSSFSRGTFLLTVCLPYLALDEIHRSIWAVFPNNPTHRQCLMVRQGPSTMGISPSVAPPSSGLRPGSPLRTLLQTTIQTTEPSDSKIGLFSWVIPPDLGLRLECLSAKRSWSLDARWAIAATTKRVEIQPPLAAMSVDVDSYLGQLRARGVREASIRPMTIAGPMIEVQYEWGDTMHDTQQTCPRLNGFGRNLRSNTLWFTGFCNSHQVSHFSTFFIDARARISIIESHFCLKRIIGPPRHTSRTGRKGREGQAVDLSIPWNFPHRG